jgi:hypothetical protein
LLSVKQIVVASDTRSWLNFAILWVFHLSPSYEPMSLLLLPILAQALTLSAGDTSEARIRSDDTGQHVDLVTTGNLALSLGLKRTTWTLSYSPSVTQLGLGESSSLLVLFNAGNLNINLRLSSRTTLNFSESASYGLQNLRALAVSAPQTNFGNTTGSPADTNPPQPGSTGPASGGSSSSTGTAGTPVLAAPEYATIKYGSFSSTIGLAHILDHNWMTGAIASYSDSGGLDAHSETIIPRAHTYSGRATLSRVLGPRDQATTLALANYTLTEPTAEAFFTSLSISWAHRINNLTSSSLSIGEAYSNSTALNGAHSAAVLPIAGATLLLNKVGSLAGGRLSATAETSVAPMVDRLTGSAIQMLNSTVGVIWNKRRFTLQSGVFGATVIGNQSQAAVVSTYGAVESASYQLDRRHWTVTAGSRQALQRFANSQQTLTLWSAFASITYRTSTGPF